MEKQSRIKNTSRNLIYAIVLQVIKVVLVFLGRIIFVKKLGATYLGINGLFSNILGILSLADLGMVTVLMYSLYKPLAENDEVKISAYMNFFKRVYNTIAIAVTVVGIALIPFLKYLVNLPEEMPNIYLYYILLLLDSVVSYLFVYKTTLLSADQKMYIINKYDTIIQFVLFIMHTAILLITSNFTLYLLSNVICTLVGNILKVRKTQEIYPYLKENKKATLPKEERKNLFTNLYSLFFYKIGSVIQNNTDNILISIFVGTITVGYYSNYSTIILNITTALSLVFTSLKASVGNYVVSKDTKDQFRMFNILEVYNFWLVAFCSISFVVLIPDFINICFGQEYVLSFSLLIWAVLNFYTSNIRQTMWIYRETTGIFKKTRHITIVTSILNIGLSIIFGYIYGLSGIIFATVVSRMAYAWWKEPLIVYKDCFGESPVSYFINYIKRIILAVVLCAITYGVCYIIPNINIYVSFILKAFICLIVPNAIILLIYKNSEAFIYLKENILKRGRKQDGRLLENNENT